MKKKTQRQTNVDEFMSQFLCVQKLYRSKIEESLKHTSFSLSRYKMLDIIDDNKVDSQKKLAEMLGISSAAVAVTIDKLESNGYIQKDDDQDDKRKNYITVTDEGKKQLKEIRAAISKINEDFFKDITDEEITYMTDSLKKLAEMNEKK